MRIIDTHAHAFADAIAPVAMSTLLKAADVRSYYDGTVSGLMSAMDRGGVALSVVAPVATKPSQVRTINDWVLSLDRDRIIPFGAMHPDFPDPSAEIARLAENGIRGIKMHSQNQDFSADEPRMAPLYRAVIDAGLVVLFHAGRDMVDWGREARPAEFARMLDAYPDLKCVLAHMGGYLFWEEVREHLCGRDVYLDTAYVPRHLPDAEFLSLIRDHGAHRVLFGSDGPWTEVGDEIAYLKEMGLSDEEQ
ncbi:MAG: amidohydrolase family protein, partial [Coriobacteriia bacterium]|nr:amidohydrolase family protein [Coriobacteriia bacterium]